MYKTQLHLVALFVSCLLLLFSNSLKAQKPAEPVNPQKDKREIDGFVVRLKPTPGNYRYEIFRGNRPVDLQEHNPET